MLTYNAYELCNMALDYGLNYFDENSEGAKFLLSVQDDVNAVFFVDEILDEDAILEQFSANIIDEISNNAPDSRSWEVHKQYLDLCAYRFDSEVAEYQFESSEEWVSYVLRMVAFNLARTLVHQLREDADN